jgi:hypothetical protein
LYVVCLAADAAADATAVQETAVVSRTAAPGEAGPTKEAQECPQQLKDDSNLNKTVGTGTDDAAAVPAQGGPHQSCGSGATLQPLQLRYAVSADKGTRTIMEDVHVCIEPQLYSLENRDR